MKRERLDQKEFYIRLAEALDGSSGDIWTETVLSGSHAGEKYLVRAERRCSFRRRGGRPCRFPGRERS